MAAADDALRSGACGSDKVEYSSADDSGGVSGASAWCKITETGVSAAGAGLSDGVES